MTPSEVLQDNVRRILETTDRVVHELPSEALEWRPDPETNSIAWLVWHVARVQDDHVAEVTNGEQVWSRDGWARRFGLDDDAMDTGYGHTPEQVAAIQPGSAGVLVEHLTAVTDRTLTFLDGVSADDLDRIVDRSWNPPVTLGVRLDSIVADNWQHVGQAALLRGMWERA